MQVYKVKRNQNIFDVAVSTHGSIEGIFDLLINNPDLSFHSQLKEGEEIYWDEEFIIYTKDEINKLGDVICYVSSYCYEDGKQVLKPIKDKRKLEILDNIFLQVQNLINKKDCGKDEK